MLLRTPQSRFPTQDIGSRPPPSRLKTIRLRNLSIFLAAIIFIDKRKTISHQKHDLSLGIEGRLMLYGRGLGQRFRFAPHHCLLQITILCTPPSSHPHRTLGHARLLPGASHFRSPVLPTDSRWGFLLDVARINAIHTRLELILSSVFLGVVYEGDSTLIPREGWLSHSYTPKYKTRWDGQVSWATISRFGISWDSSQTNYLQIDTCGFLGRHY